MPTLYDYAGRPIDLAALREEEAAPSLTGIRQVISGHPAVGLDPIRLARILREAEDGDATAFLELAEDMEERELHYRAVLGTRKNQVCGLPITVEAASDSKDDVADADFIRAWINRDELRFELFDILDAVGKGVSRVEIMWDVSGKDWLPKQLVFRDPRWFDFDRADGRTPMLRTESGPKPLSPYKFICHEHKSKSGLPIRGGLARPAAWAYLFKNFDLKSWVQFAEIFGLPIRLGKYHAGATEAEKRTLLNAVRSISRDAAAIIPDSMAIDFLETKSTGNVTLFEGFAKFLDAQMSKLVLGQTGTTDTGQHVGTANAHERVREDIEDADAVQLAATLNRDLVKPMIDLNRGPRKAYPRIQIARPKAEDMKLLVQSLVDLVPLGLEVETSVIRDKLGLPDPPAGAKVLTAPARAATPPAGGFPPLSGGDGEGDSPALAARTPASPAGQPAAMATEPPPLPQDGPDGIDQAVTEQLTDWQPQVSPLVDPILKLARECSSYDDFLARLPEVAKSQDATALTEKLARLIFAAGLAGQAGADLG